MEKKSAIVVVIVALMLAVTGGVAAFIALNNDNKVNITIDTRGGDEPDPDAVSALLTELGASDITYDEGVFTCKIPSSVTYGELGDKLESYGSYYAYIYDEEGYVVRLHNPTIADNHVFEGFSCYFDND